MPLMYGYKLDPQGYMIHRYFDSLQQLTDAGYWDAPDKVPGFKPKPKAEPEAHPEVAREPVYGAVYGEKPRGGWPRGVSRAQMAGRK